MSRTDAKNHVFGLYNFINLHLLVFSRVGDTQLLLVVIQAC